MRQGIEKQLETNGPERAAPGMFHGSCFVLGCSESLSARVNAVPLEPEELVMSCDAVCNYPSPSGWLNASTDWRRASHRITSTNEKDFRRGGDGSLRFGRNGGQPEHSLRASCRTAISTMTEQRRCAAA